MARHPRLPRAAVYRTSDDGAAGGDLARAAFARGHNVTSDLCERSGANGTRPVFSRVIAGARAQSYALVVIARLDRLGHTVLEIERQVQELLRAGGWLWVVLDGIEIATGAPGLATLEAVAAFERGRLAGLTRDGMVRVATEKHIGRPRLSNTPERAQVDKLRCEGKSWKKIARELGCSRDQARDAWRLR